MALTKEQKEVQEIASRDWNNQCKRFMLQQGAFTDKTAKACFDRHFKAMYPELAQKKKRS